MAPDISAEMWLGAKGCARGSHAWKGTSPALVPKPMIPATATVTVTPDPASASPAGSPRAPLPARTSIATQTPAPPIWVIARYSKTVRRAAGVSRLIRIAAAGTSVISSQNARNVVTSRATSTPTRTIWKRPVRTATGRRVPAVDQVRARVDHTRGGDDGDDHQEGPGERVNAHLRPQRRGEARSDGPVERHAARRPDAHQRDADRLQGQRRGRAGGPTSRAACRRSAARPRRRARASRGLSGRRRRRRGAARIVYR